MALKNGYPFYFSVVVCLCTSPLEIVVSIVSGSTEDFERGLVFCGRGAKSLHCSCIIPWANFAYLACGIKAKEKDTGRMRLAFLVCKFMRVLIATV